MHSNHRSLLSILIAARPAEGEARQVPRRLPPAENALPRAAQVRRRRQFNPAHGPEAGAGHDDADDGRPITNRNTSERSFVDDFDPTAMNDSLDIDGSMGTKKRKKLEAKAEKRQQRDVGYTHALLIHLVCLV